MNTISALRGGLDPTLIGMRAAESAAPSRSAAPAPQQPGESAVRQGAVMLASLYTRLDEAFAVATSERAASGGNPERGNPELLRKLFPPYPQEFERRAAYLDGLVGLAKQNQALSLSPDFPLQAAPDTEQSIDSLVQSTANALAGQPALGVSRNPARIAQPLSQSIDSLTGKDSA